MIKQKVTEYPYYFLVETRLTFTKKEAKAFDLDKNLKKKVNAIINRYKRGNVKRRNFTSLIYTLNSMESLFKSISAYPSGVLFHIYYSKGYLNRKDIYLNKQKAFAEEIKEKIKASIDA